MLLLLPDKQKKDAIAVPEKQTAMKPSRPAGGTSNGNGGTTTKKASSRLKNVVNYDEKRHLIDQDPEPEAHAPPPLSEMEERVMDLGDAWETESLFEDALEDLAEDKFFTDGKTVSTELWNRAR